MILHVHGTCAACFNWSSSIIRDFTETQHWFDERICSWGFLDMLLLTKLHERDSGFLVNGELKITAEIDVLEVIGKLDETEEAEETTQPPLKTRKQDNDDVLSSDLLNKTQQLKEVNGFLVLPSQVRNLKLVLNFSVF